MINKTTAIESLPKKTHMQGWNHLFDKVDNNVIF